MRRHISSTLLVALALAPVLSSCKKPAPAPPAGSATAPAEPAPAAAQAFKVTSVEVGKGITADKRVTSQTTTFGPRDTIYASVVSEGSAPSVTLAARWTYGDGQVVKEGTETIAPNGPAATAFQISRPRAWPAGKYKVEITADGSPAGTKEFEITK